MKNPFLLNARQIERVKTLGIHIDGDTTEDAKEAIIKKLRTEIEDISCVYSLEELVELYVATFGEAEILQVPFTKPKTTNVAKNNHNQSRKKVRIDLRNDISYVTPLLERIAWADNIVVQEIKTGLAVKYQSGRHLSNVFNYNELRTVYGVLHGNLYLNMVKSEEQIVRLNITHDSKWFRSFAMIPNIDIHSVVEIMNANNLSFLISINKNANKRKLSYVRKLLEIA